MSLPLLMGDVLDLLAETGCTNATQSRLHYLIKSRQLPGLMKDSAGRYTFTAADVERVRQLLKGLPSARFKRVPITAAVS